MDRIATTLILAVALWGCGSDNNPGTDEDVGTDNPGNGSETQEVSLLTLSFLNGEEIDGLPYSVNGEDNKIIDSGITGIESTVKVDDESMVWIGPDSADTSSDGHRIVEVDGKSYVHREAPINGDQVSVELNRYFAGTYRCTLDRFDYDGDEPDYKGEQQRDDEQMTPQWIEIEDGFRMETEDDIVTWWGVASDMQMQGDHFILEESAFNDLITNDQIDDDEFSFTYVLTDAYVKDVFCVAE